MRYKELTELNIDNDQGWGAQELNREVDYFGLRVLMKPSTFLNLAAPLQEEPRDSIRQHMKAGGAIASPTLRIATPEEWEKGDFTKWANVLTHEGRNRMTLAIELEGDNPVEVHLAIQYRRRRDFTPRIIEELNKRLSPEGIPSVPYKGPFFEVIK